MASVADTPPTANTASDGTTKHPTTGNSQGPVRAAIGKASTKKKRSASFLLETNEENKINSTATVTATATSATPSNRANSTAAPASISSLPSNTPIHSTATTTTKKRRPYRRTKRTKVGPSGVEGTTTRRGRITAGSAATTSEDNCHEIGDCVEDSGGDGGPYGYPPPPPGWNAFDSVLQESADLSQAALEAQQLGRLKMASTYLLLLHARLVGLGKRFDKLRAPPPQSPDEERGESGIRAGSLLLEPMEEGQEQDPNFERDEESPGMVFVGGEPAARQEVEEKYNAALSEPAPCSPPSLRSSIHDRVTSTRRRQRQSSYQQERGRGQEQEQQPFHESTSTDDNHETNVYDGDRDRAIVPRFLSPPVTTASTPLRNDHPNTTTIITGSSGRTCSQSLNDGSLNVQAISASVTQSLEQQQKQQQQPEWNDGSSNHETVHLHTMTSPSSASSNNQKTMTSIHRTSTIATTTNTTPKTAAVKQLARMLPSHIEMDQAMMEHLAKAAAQLHAARSGKGRQRTYHHHSSHDQPEQQQQHQQQQHPEEPSPTERTILYPSNDLSTQVRNNKEDLQRNTTTTTALALSSSSSVATTGQGIPPQTNRGVSFTDQESQLLKAAAQAGNPNSRALAKQTGRSEVQIKAFLRNHDTKKRLLKDLDLGFIMANDEEQAEEEEEEYDDNDDNILGALGSKKNKNNTNVKHGTSDAANHAANKDEDGGGGTNVVGTATAVSTGTDGEVSEGTGKKQLGRNSSTTSMGSGGRGRKPSTTAMNTVPNAVCDARVLLQGNMLQFNHHNDDDDYKNESVATAAQNDQKGLGGKENPTTSITATVANKNASPEDARPPHQKQKEEGRILVL